MPNVQIFDFDNNEVRVEMIDNVPHFCGKDVATALGYVLASKAVTDHCTRVCVSDTLNYRGNYFKMIPESDVYRLVMRSNLESAERFQDWVCEEVLPSIRSTGSYGMPDFSNPALAARAWADQYEARLLAEQTVAEQAPRVEYYDRVLDTSNGFSVTHIAKELGMSARRLNKELHERGIQYKQGTQWFLYSEHQDKGWTMQSTTVFEHNGTERTSHSTLWTEAGREAILNMYNSED